MRRNRIKAVINVGRGPPRHGVDRPLTPVIPSTPLSVSSSDSSSPIPPPPMTPGTPNATEKGVESITDVVDKTINRPTTPSQQQQQFPILSPTRPPPSVSPLKSPYLQRSPQRPSPSPSPTNNRHLFNTNSNSADSYEVARFMSSLPPPGGIFPSCGGGGPKTPTTLDESQIPNATPPSSSSTFQGSFSSITNDPPNSILNNSELLRQRLSKTSPGIAVSKYHQLRKDFLAKGNNPEKRQLTMLHFAFWNPPKPKTTSEETKEKSRPPSRNLTRTASVCSERTISRNELIPSRRVTVAEVPDSRSNDKGKDSSAEGHQGSGPRVKVGPDGQLIIDEQSLVVETSESQRAKKNWSEMETVSGSDFAVGSCGLYRNKRNKPRGQDWSQRETIKFYRALSMCGTDFSMMATVFRGRTRAELKAKFKREDKKNPEQISLALSSRDFDPEEGITEDEEEEYEVGGSEMVKRKKSKGKKPLTEIERRVEEEEEMERVMFVNEIVPGAAVVKPNVKKIRRTLSTENAEIQSSKKRSGGRPQAGWKTTRIEDDIDTESPQKRSSKPKMNVRKSRRISLQTKDDAEEKEKDDSPGPLEKIDRFRFDESDPLGLKVGPCQIEQVDDEEMEEVPPPPSPTSSCDLTTLRPVGEVDQSKGTEESSTKTVVTLGSPPLVKGPPYRVPGPGTADLLPSPQNETVVDEIEIEITCQ